MEKAEAGSGTPAATDKKAPEKPAATDKPAAQDQANAASSSTDVATPSASDPAKAGTSATDPSTSSQQAGATEVLSTDTTQVIVDTSPTAAAPGPDAVLRILLPTGDLFDKDLFHVDIQLGKGPRNDIVIADPAVSSAHATISYANDNYSIRDLGSRNGTYVDGERLTEPRVLQHGDVIGIGLTKLTFRLTAHDRTAAVLESSIPKPQAPPPLTEESLANAVVSTGLAKQEDVDRIRAEAKGRRLARALIEDGLATDIALRELLSSTFQLSSIDLEAAKPDETATSRLTAQFARDHQMLPVGQENGRIILAVSDPTDTAATEEAKHLLGGKVAIRLAPASQLAALIERQYAPKLVGVLPSGDSLEYPITQYETNIGKAAHNHIVLTDATVSNAHAILIAREGSYSIADMGSRNGTFVNGERLATHAHALRHGDTVQLGQTILTFRNPMETASNVTAVLSPEALDEIRKRAA
ncbi:MAG TPA: FHA domain-containing protein, partial [Blastocatellia bacterium]|nr:FHA domain-containing protein [Blastocatellia bacterium]